MEKNKWLNDPKINRKYNYIYKILNKVNGKIYVGVHRTDDLNDGYMGSGKIIKRAQEKYGIENFEKTILQFFDTYSDALQKEKEMVTKEFIEESNNYNVKEGGYGNCSWSTDMLKKFSDASIKRWENKEYREKMIKSFNTEERRKKVGAGIRNWIKNNPEKHNERMLKINKNPEKIKKMAEKHRGMKRSLEARKNMSDALKKFFKEHPEKTSKNKMFIHNKTTKSQKRININEPIPDGWVKGRLI